MNQDLQTTTEIESQAPNWDLAEVVSGLRHSREVAHNIRQGGRVRDLPSRDDIVAILEGLSAALFPTHYGRPDLNDESVDYFVGATLHATLNLLHRQVRRALRFEAEQNPDRAAVEGQAHDIVRRFASGLPDIRALLASDLRAAYQGDPAAGSLSEVLLCYPGMTAVIHYRLAHALYRLGVPLLARLISNYAHSSTGIDIHPGAAIGSGFFIDHGTGVVIGQTAILGNNVRLYQAVTLGAKRFPTDGNGALIKGIARHPIVEDDVVIYAGATVLGRITIGKGSSIGGNVWLTQDVPPGSQITQAQSRSKV